MHCLAVNRTRFTIQFQCTLLILNSPCESFFWIYTKYSNSGTGTLNGNVSISPVPEAATWAMMLLGFGAIGLTIRGRRRQVIAQVA